MKYLKTLLMIGALMFATVAVVSAQANQNVTIVVGAINALSVSSGTVSMTISTATAGSAPTDATDNTTSYNITTNGSSMKLTAVLDAVYSSGISLALNLAAPTGGSSAGSTTLTAVAQDLVTGITKKAESTLSIGYTASATTVAAPNGAGETKTVTITLTS